MKKFAACFFLLFAAAALLAGIISPHDPWQHFEPFTRPNGTHLLGTNDLGQDILSELIYATRVSMLVGLGAAVIATAFGLIMGMLAGYFRGRVDEIIMGITDVFLMIPRIPLIIILAAFLRPGFGIIAASIGALWWTGTARVVRAKTLQVRESTFVQSAQCLGFSHFHILRTDILPNIMHIVWPKFMLTVASAMISESSLSFLGLGDPAMKSWGMMLNLAFVKGGFINEMWWWFLPPGLCITLFVFSIVLFSFSLEKEEMTEMGIE